LSPDNPNPADRELEPGQELDPEQEQGQFVEGKDIEDFFQRLPGSFRWPKPNAEAVAAAVEAIHRMSGSDAARDLAAAAESTDESANTCSACKGVLPAGARFCVWCGIPSPAIVGDAVPQSQAAGAAQHHFHHHYHHLVPTRGSAPATPSAESEPSAPRGRAPSSGGSGTGTGSPTPTGGRAEASARQVVQDWAQACNTKHIDDLIELYAADATLIRSSVPPVRSLPAIREFLISLLEAGLGDVEMESLRLEIMGEIALDLGRCKMLVPVAMGKRREERGKYLIVLVRQPAGNWKIFADCWSSDLAVNAAPSKPAK
jgi:ketosteroid isomerase-like protein